MIDHRWDPLTVVSNEHARGGQSAQLHGVVREEAGRIDVLFVNAAGGESMPLADIAEDHSDRTFATDVKGTLFTVQKALPLRAPVHGS